MKRCNISILLIAVLSVCSCSSSKEVVRAKEFLDAGMFDQAVILLKQEVQASPKNAEAHLLLGSAYLGTGAAALADQEFNTALVLDPGLKQEAGKRCYEIGRNLAKTNKARAHAALMKAKEFNPDIDKEEEFFFKTYIDTEENDAARNDAAKRYLTLFPSGPNTARATYEVAEGLLSGGDAAQAKPYFQQAASQFADSEWGKKASNRLANWTGTKTVSISSQAMWVDTGIILAKAGSLEIVASGQWTDGGQPVRYWGPNGTGNTWPGTILANANLDALVGKVGEATFTVGEGYSGSSPASGRLYLSINDVPGSFLNNSGTMNVRIKYAAQ
ncbi:MAG: hypothetical protein JWM21_3527 [Acidobacteria bacterium]|nr:hypothetical protein [Acidobacteriota bacterium]